jgi:pimeloyl-ACP methyl ester carboxylesterase
VGRPAREVSVQRTEHIIEGTFAYRFEGPNPDHALLVNHGMGGHGGIYDEFCGHHASRGVDVWSVDLPGHGRSAMASRQGQWTVDEWVEACAKVAAHIHDLTGLTVFAKGPSGGPADTTSPILFTVGENDPIAAPAVVRAVAALVGGPVEVYEHPGGVR